MQKYYLLIFNDDYADEHNVPACVCFTEAQYQKWAESPTGKKNDKYEEQLTAYNEALAKYENYENLIREHMKNPSPELKLRMDAAKVPYVSHRGDPKKFFSGLSAFLGNNGEGFEDGYEKYETGKAFVEAGIVKVHEVNKEFFEVFNEVRLYDLSLCNIFEDDLSDNVYED